MPTVTNRANHNDQNGIYDGSSGLYASAASEGNQNMAPGSVFAIRMHTHIPAGATVNSATLKFYYNSKFGDQNGNSNHTLFYQTSANANALVNGEAYSSRTKLSVVTFDANILANSGYNEKSFDVTAQINNLLNNHLLVPGGAVTFFLVCNSESGDLHWRTDATGEHPRLVIDYNDISTTTHTEFNSLMNSSFATNVESWTFADFFQGVATTNASATRDTVFTREGRPTMKITTATPDGTKPTGVMCYQPLSQWNTSYIFCGWIYVPSSLTPRAVGSFYYIGQTNFFITAKDTWIPFCSNPWVMTGNDQAMSYPFVGIETGYSQGQNFWLSDLAVYPSAHHQMPFTAYTPNKPNVTIQTRYNAQRGPQVRTITPKTKVGGGTGRGQKQYVRNQFGIWTLTSTKRQFLTFNDVETTGRTYDQLEATGKTWDQLEYEALHDGI